MILILLLVLVLLLAEVVLLRTPLGMIEWTCLKYSLLYLLFSNSRDEPPEMDIITPKVGKGLDWLCVGLGFLA